VAKISAVDNRLDRIEEKIDKLVEAIISIARAEEKIITLSSFSKQQAKQIQDLINRIEELEVSVAKNTNTVRLVNRTFWLVMSSAITAIVAMMFMNSNSI
jgi:archaellum component FlaC|tara:strand:- start:1153 stop:1452 length:300 start_codon:yes stop_codon:yes gene_type:complete